MQALAFCPQNIQRTQCHKIRKSQLNYSTCFFFRAHFPGFIGDLDDAYCHGYESKHVAMPLTYLTVAECWNIEQSTSDRLPWAPERPPPWKQWSGTLTGRRGEQSAATNGSVRRTELQGASRQKERSGFSLEKQNPHTHWHQHTHTNTYFKYHISTHSLSTNIRLLHPSRKSSWMQMRPRAAMCKVMENICLFFIYVECSFSFTCMTVATHGRMSFCRRARTRLCGWRVHFSYLDNTMLRCFWHYINTSTLKAQSFSMRNMTLAHYASLVKDPCDGIGQGLC